MALTCENCGGEVTRAALQAGVCEYCGAVLEAPRKEAPSSLGRPTVGQSTGRERSPAGWVVLAALALAVLGGAAYFVVGGGATATLTEWYSSGGCLVDANGDDALDLVGWNGTSPTNHALALVDGATGRRLWIRRGEWENQARVLCTSRRTFAVARPSFLLELYPLEARDNPRAVQLTDTVQRYGATPGCVRLVLADHTELGLDPSTGARAACPTTELTAVWEAPGLVDRAPAEASMQGVVYSVAPREQGTPVLTVTARRGALTLWQTQLRQVALNERYASVAATPRAIVTYASPIGDDRHGVLVGLSPTTGEILYERQQGSTWSSNVLGFQQNGRFVVVTWGFGLHAYDPATGERVWHIGGR